MISVLICEDIEVQRLAYVEALTACNDFRIVAAVGSAEEAVSLLASRTTDILLTDLGLPGMDGVELIANCRTQQPQCRSLVLSVFDDVERVVRAVAAGASGYILKDEPLSSLPDTLRAVHKRGVHGSDFLATTLMRHVQASEEGTGSAAAIEVQDSFLSERETAVLHVLAKGLSINEIADVLDISANTVKTHLKNIYGKLDVNSRTEAIYEASVLGLVGKL